METSSKPHIGRKISRIRELRGMKQEALAIALGVSQQTVSNLENSEEVEEGRLEEVARALGVTVEGLKAFSEEAVINFFNNISDNDFSETQVANFGTIGANFTFNPVDKIVELYERLVKAEKERADALERLLKKES